MAEGERWQKPRVIHNRLVVWGAADQGRVNYPILKQLGYQIEAFVDDTPGKLTPFPKVPIFMGWGGLEEFLEASRGVRLGFVVAIGNPYGHVRTKLHRLLKEKSLLPVSFSDPTALICNTVTYGDGLQVMPGVILHNFVKIGEQCILNTRALVEHDCILEDGVEIGPGAVLCGRVKVGENTWIGANATVNPRITIGANTIIGAGAVVVSNIPSNVVAVGVPARVIRENLRHE